MTEHRVWSVSSTHSMCVAAHVPCGVGRRLPPCSPRWTLRHTGRSTDSPKGCVGWYPPHPTPCSLLTSRAPPPPGGQAAQCPAEYSIEQRRSLTLMVSLPIPPSPSCLSVWACVFMCTSVCLYSLQVATQDFRKTGQTRGLNPISSICAFKSGRLTAGSGRCVPTGDRHRVCAKCCSSSRQSSEEETPFLGPAVRVDFLEEVGLEEASRNRWTCDSRAPGQGVGV